MIPKFRSLECDSGSLKNVAMSGSWNHLESLFTPLSGGSSGRTGRQELPTTAPPSGVSLWSGLPLWPGLLTAWSIRVVGLFPRGSGLQV